MSTLEYGIRQARMGINSGVNPDRLGKPGPEQALNTSLVITPEFFTKKLAQLKNVINLINIQEIREKRLLVAENPSFASEPEKVPDTDVIVTEIPNPHKAVLDKLPNINRSMQRAWRRGGRGGCQCRNKDNKESKGCMSRRCEKKRNGFKIVGSQQQRASRQNEVATAAVRRVSSQPRTTESSTKVS